MPVATDRSPTPIVSEMQFSSSYAWYVVLVLMVCYTLSFVDRQILSLLVGPIKQDLGISDARIGLLQGLAFGTFYTVLGVPMGRIADRGNRRNLIVAGIFFWSLMTALCSVARSFWSLFSARLGVGVGEATLGPSAFSLIADYFPRERLGKSLSVYSAGIFIGAGLALIVGGTVVSAVTGLPAVQVPFFGAVASWRFTFLIVGGPGILIALLVYTIREPFRRNALRGADGQIAHLSYAETLDQLRPRWRSVAGVSLGLGTQAMCNYALQAWAPTFFIRVFGWTPRQVGLVLGVMILTTGIAGMYVGGTLCERWQRSRCEAPLKVGVVSTLGAGVFFILAMVIQDLRWTIPVLAPALFFLAMPVGSSYAALQLIVPNQLRGQVSALLLFTINVVGLIGGPWLVGVLNDLWGAKMVGYSLAITVGLASFVSAALFRATYGPYRDNYAMMHRES